MKNDRIVLLLILGAFLLGILWTGGYGMMGYGMMGYGMMGFGLLFMLIVLGLIIWLAVTLSGPKNGQDAMAVLKRRYARGQITKKQYEKMKKGLEE